MTFHSQNVTAVDPKPGGWHSGPADTRLARRACSALSSHDKVSAVETGKREVGRDVPYGSAPPSSAGGWPQVCPLYLRHAARQVPRGLLTPPPRTRSRIPLQPDARARTAKPRGGPAAAERLPRAGRGCGGFPVRLRGRSKHAEGLRVRPPTRFEPAVCETVHTRHSSGAATGSEQHKCPSPGSDDANAPPATQRRLARAPQVPGSNGVPATGATGATGAEGTRRSEPRAGCEGPSPHGAFLEAAVGAASGSSVCTQHVFLPGVRHMCLAPSV